MKVIINYRRLEMVFNTGKIELSGWQIFTFMLEKQYLRRWECKYVMKFWEMVFE